MYKFILANILIKFTSYDAALSTNLEWINNILFVYIVHLCNFSIFRYLGGF